MKNENRYCVRCGIVEEERPWGSNEGCSVYGTYYGAHEFEEEHVKEEAKPKCSHCTPAPRGEDYDTTCPCWCHADVAGRDFTDKL